MKCFHHTTEDAVATCGICGVGLCKECEETSEFRMDGKALCKRCNAESIREVIEENEQQQQKAIFYKMVDSEIRRALPRNWKFIHSEKLLGVEPYKIRHAFNSSPIDGKYKLINVLALDSSLNANEDDKQRLVKLRDYIISKNCLLIVICQDENSDALNDISCFVSEVLHMNSPNFFALYLGPEDEEKTGTIIHDIWCGKLKYFGPKPGYQKVNLEIMKDECWKCGQSIRTVTGIVFPNRQLSKWDNADWAYFGSNIPLAFLTSKHAQVIKDYVEKLRISP